MVSLSKWSTFSGFTLIAAIALSGAAQAQLLGGKNAAGLGHVGQLKTNQSVVGVGVGNGMVQGQKVLSVGTKGQPLVGASALSSGPVSGNKTHFGSVASVSVLNNEQLLGVQGPGGFESPVSVSVRNPRKAPVLSGKQQR